MQENMGRGTWINTETGEEVDELDRDLLADLTEAELQAFAERDEAAARARDDEDDDVIFGPRVDYQTYLAHNISGCLPNPSHYDVGAIASEMLIQDDRGEYYERADLGEGAFWGFVEEHYIGKEDCDIDCECDL